MKKFISWFSWSTGKDSAFALMTCLKNQDIEIQCLFSCITQEYDRVSMHSTRIKLLKKQAQSLNLPLRLIEIPAECSNQIYEKKMAAFVHEAKNEKIDSMIFGDLFLEGIREYRENNLKETGIKPIFPIWGKDSIKLSEEIIDLGFKAIITCVDSKKLGKEFVGRQYDRTFLKDLPEGIDPCGEYGEFHTFVYDGPIFNFPIACKVEDVVLRDSFYFADVIAL